MAWFMRRSSERTSVMTVYHRSCSRRAQGADVAGRPSASSSCATASHVWAALFGAAVAAWHRLWLALLGLRGRSASRFGVALMRSAVSARCSLVDARCSSLLFGFEAASLRRWRWRGAAGSRSTSSVADDRKTPSSASSTLAAAQAQRRRSAAGAAPRRAAADATAGAAAAAPPRRTRRHRPVSGARSAAMSVAIIDYGSGNLHSAAKAFERAAREHGLDQRDHGDQRSRRGARAPIASCCPASAPSPIAGGGSMPSPAWSRRWTRRCARKGRPFFGICVGMQLMASAGSSMVTPGLGWIGGDVDAHHAARSSAEDPAYGLEHARRARARIRCSTASRSGGRPARLFRAFLSISCRERGRCGGAGRLRRPDHRDRRPRQHGRHAIPSREEPEARACADRQFPEVDSRDPVPRHRPEGRPMRPPRAGRHGARHRVQPRSGRAGASLRARRASNICMSSISTAPSPASR